MKSLLPALVLPLVLLFGCSKSGAPATGTAAIDPILPVGTVAADFTAMRADGTPVKLSDYKGKVVLVDFWATWCGPCKISMPHIESLHKKLESQGLVVLGVCVSDSKENFDKWMKTPEVPTSYLKLFDASQPGKTFADRDYKVSGIPALFVIDKEGKVAFSAMGAGSEVEAALDKALASAGFKL